MSERKSVEWVYGDDRSYVEDVRQKAVIDMDDLDRVALFMADTEQDGSRLTVAEYRRLAKALEWQRERSAKIIETWDTDDGNDAKVFARRVREEEARKNIN